MLKILKILNVVSLAQGIMKYGEYAKLAIDTAKYFYEEGVNRGIIERVTTDKVVEAVTGIKAE